MLFVVLSVTEEPESYVLSVPMLIAVAGTVISGVIVMICTLAIRRRYSRHKLTVRDRVVSMHTNALYLQDNTALFEKNMKNSTVYNVTTTPLLISGWMSHCPASLSEYEIPLDEKWEIPRAWYVKHSSVYALRLVVTDCMH